jgi:hypothetical protein
VIIEPTLAKGIRVSSIVITRIEDEGHTEAKDEKSRDI